MCVNSLWVWTHSCRIVYQYCGNKSKYTFSRHFCPKWLKVIHVRCRPAHQEQFGIQYLAQGNFNKQTRGNWTSDPLIINDGSTPEPHPANVYRYIYIHDNHSWYTLLQSLFTHPTSQSSFNIDSPFSSVFGLYHLLGDMSALLAAKSSSLFTGDFLTFVCHLVLGKLL